MTTITRCITTPSRKKLVYSTWRYSRGTSLTYGYLINPKKIRSLSLSKTHLKNAASILKLDTLWKKSFRSFIAKNFRAVGQRAAKLLAFKVGVLKKKSASSAIPPVLCAIAFGPGSMPGLLKSFSKFDSWQLWSPLTYRPQIFSIEGSKPVLNFLKSSID